MKRLMAVAVAVAALIPAATAAEASPRGVASTLRTGDMVVERTPGYGMTVHGLAAQRALGTPGDPNCPATEFGGECGTLEVPLYHDTPDGRTLTIGYELYRHWGDGPAESTIIPNNGGPGGATRSLRGFYTFFFGIFGNALEHHDLLLVDDRGRGTSGAIVCDGAALADSEYTREDVATYNAACAATLGGAHGAAAAYASGEIASDYAAVLDDIGAGLVTFVGTSYGGIDAQAFASRYPTRVRAIVSDAGVDATDVANVPFFTQPLSVSRHAIQSICGRQPSCAKLNTDPIGDLADMLARVKSGKVKGSAPDGSGAVVPVTATTRAVFNAMFQQNFFRSFSQGELPAVAAAFDEGDAQPLLRMTAETRTPGAPEDPTDFSGGAYQATVCADMHADLQMDLAAPVATQFAQYDERSRILRRAQTAPFGTRQWADVVGDWGGEESACFGWPDIDPRPVIEPGSTMPDVPVLINAGEYDWEVGPSNPAAWQTRFPQATVVQFTATQHAPLFSSECAGAISVHFVETLEVGDTSCATQPIDWYAVAEFPKNIRDARKADRLPGDRSSDLIRKAGAVAAETVLDGIKRGLWFSPTLGGLRGGSIAYDTSGPEWILDFDSTRYASDLAVTGRVAWGATNTVEGDLVLAGGARGTIHVSAPVFQPWNGNGDSTVTITGTINGRSVNLSLPVN